MLLLQHYLEGGKIEVEDMCRKIERNEKIIVQCAGALKKIDECLQKQEVIVKMLSNDFASRLEHNQSLEDGKGYA